MRPVPRPRRCVPVTVTCRVLALLDTGVLQVARAGT